MRYLRPLRDRYGSSYQPFHRLLNGEFNASRWLDHWGTTRLERRDGRPEVTKNVLFVSEPYDFNERMVADLERLCEVTRLRWQLDSNSWWSPGRTHRILVRPGDEEPKSMREIEAERRAKFREEIATICAGRERTAGAELVNGPVLL